MGAAPARALQKWGNSTGVRIPKEVMAKAEVAVGDEVQFEVAKPGVIVLRATRSKPTLDELLKGTTKEQFGGEYDWGRPVGDEVW
jgi:antitoxin MazE